MFFWCTLYQFDTEECNQLFQSQKRNGSNDDKTGPSIIVEHLTKKKTCTKEKNLVDSSRSKKHTIEARSQKLFHSKSLFSTSCPFQIYSIVILRMKCSELTYKEDPNHEIYSFSHHLHFLTGDWCGWCFDVVPRRLFHISKICQMVCHLGQCDVLIKFVKFYICSTLYMVIHSFFIKKEHRGSKSPKTKNKLRTFMLMKNKF